MTKKKKEAKIEELERRIVELEKQKWPLMVFPPQQVNFLHFHNGMSCVNNPCVWC